MAQQDKAILLDNPGTRIQGVLAYDVMTLQVDAVENTRALGRFTISPSSLVFGQTATLSIGNADQVSCLYLTMRLVVPVATPNVYAGAGWGYQAINSFNYLFGPSSLGPHNISGYGALLANLAAAESSPKRQAIIDLGGPVVNGPGTYDAVVILPIVMSNTFTSPSKLPLDLVGLNSPLIVNIIFGQARDFLSGTSVGSITNFNQAWLTTETYYLTDRNASPALQSRTYQGVMVAYPFYYIQSGTIPNFVINGAGQETPLALTNLINADPMAVVFAVYRQSSVVQSGAVTAPLCASAMLRPDGVRFLINGEVWNLTPSANLATMDEFMNGGASNVITSAQMDPPAQGAFPFLLKWDQSSFYLIQFSQQRCVAQTGLMANTRRTPQATPQLLLTFNTDPAEALVLHYIYIYQAMVKMAGGNSTIYLA